MGGNAKQKFDNKCVEMIRQILDGKIALRKAVYKEKDPKMYHRLVHMVVENYELLLKIVKKSNYMNEDLEMAVVRCYQILDGKLKNARMKRKFIELMGGVKLKFTRQPVFVRINTLRGGCENDMSAFVYEKTPLDGVFKVMNPEVLNGDEAYNQGKIVIQNISSCLPALILNPDEGSVVIDTCSAPGNKTSHLSMIMKNTGKIHAFEKDESRAKILRTQLEKLGVGNTEVIEGDFLQSVPDDFKDVEYILCDPSCSGSGMHLNYKMDLERVGKLKQFQIYMVKHALQFNPKRLVYSVCSEHKEEGEDVVEEALKDSKYQLEDISKFWPQNTVSESPVSKYIIRCKKDTDGATGFFIASFIRRD
ncbi:tRNA/rRNA cytosine-C5-methylase [Ordospora colligata]|uniref:tRNA/rRNA cytosine-C5-methylase n=1 Tax=Ordospora colligata OC4 TaxID=1354746 RepID=A0A0B2UIZ7_9MICR|nr:tRNA/rRNA cytosine-C5-methylase [Ordospora colligata OC4]KHN69288.1 tRNA/rRNA cytosine-C5-methylase [Ordospora colligata OC4]TBU15104.1 tRNA/rRNA cytosine-C5-methylase [Ordospora colligata]TBU15155.1 tRNA/rRNA cytosine-C5-methylase [Ordospora colligata]TBU18401.1 tRNA/rRNA cytosine-C5-methylase [Ordospora colligata]